MKTIIILLLLTVNLPARLIISEVLFNEPGNRVNLEWVELYNFEDTTVNLGQYYLVSGNDTSVLANGTYLQGQTYLILARKLISNDGSDSFEGYWGDSSGVWGDSPGEDFPANQANFQLTNNFGFIRFYDNSGSIISDCSWNSPTKDGFSMEIDNVLDENSRWHECTSTAGCTPGKVNSIPAENIIEPEIEINPKIISISNDGYPGNLAINYSIPAGIKASIAIHSDSGRKMRSLIINLSGQYGQIEWDGRDDSYKFLRPGVYIIVLELSGGSGNKYIPIVIAP